MVGANLDPYSHSRLMQIVGPSVTGWCGVLTTLAIWRVEQWVDAFTRSPTKCRLSQRHARGLGRAQARKFTLFRGFLSMTAYFMPELILTYAGLGPSALRAGQSTRCRARRIGGVFLSGC